MRWWLALLTVFVLTFFLGPLLWQLVTALWPDGQLGQPLPSRLTLDNFGAVFTGRPFFRVILSSVVVAVGTTLVCVSVAALSAFALAKLEVPFGRALLAIALGISMFPPIATVSPLYLTLRTLRLRDSVLGLVIPYSTFALPLSLWILTTLFRQLPDELYRAARVDGCSPFQAFRKIILPLSKPGLLSTALIVFVFSWNELLYALTFISSPSKRTIPVEIALFASDFKEPWAEMSAASLIATLPLVVLTLAFQRHIVQGLTAGAVKE
jgi:multiple sugar transport system permease protein